MEHRRKNTLIIEVFYLLTPVFREEDQLLVHRAEVRRPSWFLRRWSHLSQPPDLARPSCGRPRQRGDGLHQQRESGALARTRGRVSSFTNSLVKCEFVPDQPENLTIS